MATAARSYFNHWCDVCQTFFQSIGSDFGRASRSHNGRSAEHKRILRTRTATIGDDPRGDDGDTVWETPEFEGDNASDGVPPRHRDDDMESTFSTEICQQSNVLEIELDSDDDGPYDSEESTSSSDLDERDGDDELPAAAGAKYAVHDMLGGDSGDEHKRILRTATIHAEHGGDAGGNVWETPEFEGDNASDGVPPVFIV
jgi:hypothetical protein